MNYLIIQDSTTPSTKVPPNVIQIFTNDGLYALKRFMQDAFDQREDHSSLEDKAASTLMHLLQQWEDRSK